MRTNEHLEHNDIHDNYQSVYRRDYRTEISLLKVNSYIAEALDEGSTTALTSLDSSTTEAFRIFVWYQKYGINLDNNVAVADRTSPDAGLHFGIQQETVLGTKNYCMYV